MVHGVKDWLGQEISEGDNVLYAAQSGRSVTMVLATVVKFNENKSVTVQPVRTARWKQHHGRTRYIDKRTGKGIDPWAASGKHTAVDGHYIDRITGKPVADAERNHLMFSRDRKWDDFEYKPTVFKDYVERAHEDTTKVVLTVTQNITKWTGEVPSG